MNVFFVFSFRVILCYVSLLFVHFYLSLFLVCLLSILCDVDFFHYFFLCNAYFSFRFLVFSVIFLTSVFAINFFFFSFMYMFIYDNCFISSFSFCCIHKSLFIIFIIIILFYFFSTFYPLNKMCNFLEVISQQFS